MTINPEFMYERLVALDTHLSEIIRDAQRLQRDLEAVHGGIWEVMEDEMLGRRSDSK